MARRRVRATSSSGQEKVLDYLAENPDATLQKAAEHTGLSLAGAKKIVSVLLSAKLLERVGSKKAGKWIVRR